MKYKLKPGVTIKISNSQEGLTPELRDALNHGDIVTLTEKQHKGVADKVEAVKNKEVSSGS